MFGHKPSENARRIIEFLGCECEYIPAGKSPQHIQNEYENLLAAVKREKYYPVIICVDDVLAETLGMFTDELEPGETMGDRRRKIIGEASGSAEKWFSDRLAALRSNYDENEWNSQVIGDIDPDDSGKNSRFSGFTDYSTGKAREVILARIPVENPWEIFAWLPFGGWNECPAPEEMVLIGRYWYDRYKAIPAVISHDVLEFAAMPVKDESAALGLALEQFAFCEDIVYQGTESVGKLAGMLMQSSVWYFWWD